LSLMMADCAWNPAVPVGHTPFSWNGTNPSIPDSKTPEPPHQRPILPIKCPPELNKGKHGHHVRSTKDKHKIKCAMKAITSNWFLCKHCQRTLENRTACFTPNCYFWSSPEIASVPDSKHHSICHRHSDYQQTDDRSKWHRFKGIVAYDGYDFYGWQSQLNVPTIQDLLEWRLSSYFKRKINVMGCSRTDARVHANNQCFHVDLPVIHRPQLCKLDDHALCQFVMSILNAVPQCIAIKSVERVPRSFHSRFSCFGKTYIYRIIQKRRCLPSERKYHWNLNERNRKRIDVKAMVAASRILIGNNDFTALAVENEKNKIEMASYRGETPSAIKQMKRIEIDTANQESNIEIRMTSSGFLYKMARTIVGTLIEVGMGNLSVDRLEKIFRSRRRTKEIVTAPGHGLAIDKVFYDEAEWKAL